MNNKIFLIILTVCILNSCSFNRVFGYKKDDFMSRISQGDYRFLDDVDYTQNSIKEINRLGEGASYYMSFVYKNRNQLLFTNKLLYQEVQNKNEYYGPKSAYLLIKQLLQERDYVKAELHALNFFELYSGEFPEIRKQLIEAKYWQKKNSEVIAYIDQLDRSLYSNYSNNELDLLKTVAKARMDIDGWQEEYKNLFLNQPLSPLLKRAYSFIDVFPDYAEGFTREEIKYFYAISLASRGDYENAQRVLRPLLFSETWIFDTTQSIKNCSKVIKTSRYITVNLEAFKSALETAPETKKADALISYASLYYNKESFSSVINILEEEISSISIGKTRDDALWLYLLSLSHVGRDKVISQLNLYMDTISDSSYAHVIIDHVITALVQNSDWSRLVEMLPITEKWGSLEEQSRIKWINSRIYHYDYISSDSNREEQLLDEIITSDDYSYYSFIANALLKRESNIVLKDPQERTELDIDNLWIKGFMEYGLLDEAVEFSRLVEEMNYGVVIDIATNLHAQEEHLETLRFLSRNGIDLNKETFSLYYPLPFRDHITKIADRYNFSPALFSGLIRTESGFDMHEIGRAHV